MMLLDEITAWQRLKAGGMAHFPIRENERLGRLCWNCRYGSQRPAQNQPRYIPAAVICELAVHQAAQSKMAKREPVPHPMPGCKHWTERDPK